MKIIIFFVLIFGIIILIKVITNLKFINKDRNINSENSSIKPEFSDNDIPLSKALNGFKRSK